MSLYIDNFMCWGTEKKKYVLGAKQTMCFGGNRRVVRVNEEYVISFSRMG